jgi:hypothetical protein
MFNDFQTQMYSIQLLVLCWSFLNRPQEPLKTKPLLRKAGLRSDPRCTLGELCARPSSEGAAKLEKKGKENGRHFLIY